MNNQHVLPVYQVPAITLITPYVMLSISSLNHEFTRFKITSLDLMGCYTLVDNLFVTVMLCLNDKNIKDKSRDRQPPA